MPSIFGQLKAAFLEKIAGNPSSTTSGRIHYDTTANKMKYHNGTIYEEVVGKAETQTLTNKTLSIASNTFGSGAASAGTVLTADGAGGTSFAAQASAPSAAYDALNLALSVSVAANAMTIALKTQDGGDPAGGDPVKVGFRDTTAASGGYTQVSITSALSLTITSGATLGHTSAMEQYVWVYLINNAGTVDIAVSGVDLFDEGTLQSTTAMSSSADSGTVLYSGGAYTSKAIRLIGRIKSNQATAGTWATTPSEVSIGIKPQKKVTEWASYTLTLGSTGTAPTYGTITKDSAMWYRDGKNLYIYWDLEVGAGTDGTGTYLIPLPSGLTIDSNIITATASAKPRSMIGTIAVSAADAARAQGFVKAYDSSNLAAILVDENATGTYGLWGPGGVGFGFGSARQATMQTYSIPITGWSTYGP